MRMANRILTLKEAEQNLARIVEEVCAEEGITPKEFYEAFRQAWNAAIAREEKEELDR
jgi:hypothetical protein